MTAVEFALVAAPFLALLVATFETALVFFAGRVLDEVTEEASRYILTGQAQQSNMTQAQFLTLRLHRLEHRRARQRTVQLQQADGQCSELQRFRLSQHHEPDT